jgi:LuxR family maltose regulon positive regulatory protein
MPQFPEGATLVVDDAHLLDTAVLQRGICSSTMLASGRLRVILVGQSRLEGCFARELASGEASLIGHSELALTPEETVGVLNANGASLEADEVTAATRGWPAAVRLQVMAAEGKPGSDGKATSAHLVGDYIERAVLPTLPDHLRDFVLRATTCTRLDGRLADALAEGDHGARLLEECAVSGLFLDRVVDAAGHVVYRWHEVFAEECRSMLMRDDPVRARRLNRIAAERLRRRFPPVAIEHALAADAPELARKILRTSWLRMLLESQVEPLERLCLAMPGGLPEERDLLLIRACCRSQLNDPAGAGLLHRRATTKPILLDAPFIESFAELLLAASPTQKALATDRATTVLGQSCPDDDYPHGLFLLGWSELTLRRNGETAVRLLRSALAEAKARGLPHLERISALDAALALSFAGEFADADATLTTLTPKAPGRPGEWEPFDGGITTYIRGHNAFWRGELHRALESFSAIVERDRVDTPIVSLARAFFALTVAELGRADLFDIAEQQLKQVRSEDSQGVPWAAYRQLALGRLLEAQDRIPDAHRAVRHLLERDARGARPCRGENRHRLPQAQSRTRDRGTARHVLPVSHRRRELQPTARRLRPLWHGSRAHACDDLRVAGSNAPRSRASRVDTARARAPRPAAYQHDRRRTGGVAASLGGDRENAPAVDLSQARGLDPPSGTANRAPLVAENST